MHVSFLLGDSKVAPRCATSIPRLELCAAAEAVRTASEIVKELMRKPDQITYYSDSLVVLGYLCNTEKRFRRYVARRVELIVSTAPANQWQYISTRENPADMASRPQDPSILAGTCWLSGPDFLWSANGANPCSKDYKPLSVYDLPEIEQEPWETLSLRTTSEQGSKSEFLGRLLVVSSWHRLRNVVKKIFEIARGWLQRVRPINNGINLPKATNDEAIIFLLKDMQGVYHKEISLLSKGISLPRAHRFSTLVPSIDKEGLVRVGGRLRRGDFPFSLQCPIMIPQNHPGTFALLHFYHSSD